MDSRKLRAAIDRPQGQILGGTEAVLLDRGPRFVETCFAKARSLRDLVGNFVDACPEVGGVDATARTLMRITRDQILRWADARRVPYEPGSVRPESARFWKAVSEILTTGVRFDSPRAMDPMAEPDAEIEALFDAVVQPAQTQQSQAQRIDSAITRALGKIADRIPANPSVSAFGGTTERVRQGLETDQGVLLLDGVNLAAATARKEADALVSRLMRIHTAHPGRRVRTIVGYASSPGGLNGEAHMRDWIREQVADQVFDVNVEQAELRKAAEDVRRELTAGLRAPLGAEDRPGEPDGV